MRQSFFLTYNPGLSQSAEAMLTDSATTLINFRALALEAVSYFILNTYHFILNTYRTEAVCAVGPLYTLYCVLFAAPIACRRDSLAPSLLLACVLSRR